MIKLLFLLKKIILHVLKQVLRELLFKHLNVTRFHFISYKFKQLLSSMGF